MNSESLDSASRRALHAGAPSLLVAPSAATGRLDKWLWSVRLFKTRSLATDACRAGSVTINGQVAKPARDVRHGEVILVQQGLVTRTVKVLDIPKSRVGPKIVSTYCDDQTPAAEFEKGKTQPIQQFLARERGSGRPTKRDRRALDRLFQ